MSKIILITGASNGIGYYTALKLALAGTTVIAVARNNEKLVALKQEILKGNTNAEIFILPFDLSSSDFSSLADQLKKWNIAKLDGLINNAGLLINKPFEELEYADFKNSYDVNVFAPAMLIKSLLPLLEQSPDSHIVNISSMGGVQGSSKYEGLSAYSSGKGALVTLTECLAVEFSKKSIKINCLALGSVNTEMLAQAFPGYKAPLSAEQMGEWISWFAVNGQKFFNGQVIPVTLSNP